MGILATQLITHISEALIYEGVGAQIDLLPKNTTLSKVITEEGVWAWSFQVYSGVPLHIFFYVEKGLTLTHVQVMQGPMDHKTTKAEVAIISEAFEWLLLEGVFHVKKTKSESE